LGKQDDAEIICLPDVDLKIILPGGNVSFGQNVVRSAALQAEVAGCQYECNYVSMKAGLQSQKEIRRSVEDRSSDVQQVLEQVYAFTVQLMTSVHVSNRKPTFGKAVTG